ncbi:uncharacterized protein FFB20_08078 [Fusarium fujikuroi]|nr:uncharacterized protein FFB20_08078 [Fusarium fujikuroi]
MEPSDAINDNDTGIRESTDVCETLRERRRLSQDPTGKNLEGPEKCRSFEA